ncbi:bro-b [Antheraea pernyi nucleopolyhedrovirus]|uniref:Baculovirus repeated ORF n=2 Tax=Antheraea pernyi nuclear polyhedrosis virus TaxID=161494 RepID=Q7T5G1_NPVAP|nr:bro-b [Antheraea pernyi nucleopolyhedrovirus]AFY62865.1 bro b [Philosamia cynthia ricini nucleopolyhedrovirus virus]AWD33579.1 baculovirus repeated ORF [Antheraea proylei nucleopolyhedrovirus]BBD50515.1 baculovirus repeated orf [Antheraea yamamai nucleopolyhedrovirus]BBD50667.1 baculovirus repeated orf [Samia cynthia nucleopolyhedrovirus]BBD51123.1 baculovirus repeated orf [Samia ricini nucleopolyhedrovirus]
MALSKIDFVNGPLEVFTVQDVGRENWMVANPFAETLKYSKPNKAIVQHVSKQNQKTLEELRSNRCGTIASSLHPQTKFINTAGVFELINASGMPAAKKFKQWNTNDLLPTLCQEGEYSMVVDAPPKIAEGMNAVHVATNEGQEAPWAKDLEFYKVSLAEKDKIIAIKTNENQQLATALQTANQNLMDANKNLMTAFTFVNEARKDSEAARRETAQLANRMADIAQDVIAKPSNPQLCHSLAVCELGNNEFAFLRPQKRSMRRSLRRLGSSDVIFSSDYVPNSMNVLNKVKESIPRDKFKARHNKITLLENYTKEQLMDVINCTMTERQIARLGNMRNLQ